MNKLLIITIIALTIWEFSGLSISTNKFPKPNQLKMAIVESIDIPFGVNDTVIYNSSGICGNSSQWELNRYYEPNLKKTPLSDILIENFDGTILFDGYKLHQMVDSICKNQDITVQDCFYKNKVDFSLTGKALTNRSVEIYERYFLNDDRVIINKIFSYKKGKWTCKILQNHKISNNEEMVIN